MGTASASIYANCLPTAFAKKVNLTSDTLKMALFKSTYTPNLQTDAYWSTISTHECSGTGYTTGGVTVTSPTLTLTKANTWTHSRAATTTYAYGQIVRPATGNGFLYRCVVAGKSGASLPTYPTVEGKTVADGTATWACLGDAVLVFSSATPTWNAVTVTAKYAVIYDAATGTGSSEPLICLQTFATTQSPAGAGFAVAPDSTLGWFCFSPPS